MKKILRFLYYEDMTLKIRESYITKFMLSLKETRWLEIKNEFPSCKLCRRGIGHSDLPTSCWITDNLHSKFLH